MIPLSLTCSQLPSLSSDPTPPSHCLPPPPCSRSSSPPPPSPPPPSPPPQTSVSVAWNAAEYTACNVVASSSTVGAIAESMATLKACHISNPADSTECTADETTTLLAVYPVIAATRATCLAAGYPSGSAIDYTSGESLVVYTHTCPSHTKSSNVCLLTKL